MDIEQKLIGQCIKGERKAQFLLYKKMYSFMMGVCLRYANNNEDARGLVNLGFLKVLNNLEKRKEQIPFGLWARRVIINCIIDEYRKNKKDKELMEYHDFTDRQDEDALVEVNDAVKRMDVAEIQVHIDRLPKLSRKVFNLFVIDGYGHKEIADMLGMSEGTSKWHLSTAKQKLRDSILGVTEVVKKKIAV